MNSEELTPFDLHVLSTPPALILSQDRTLMFKFRSFKIIAWLFSFRYCLKFVKFVLNNSQTGFFRTLLFKEFSGLVILFNYQGSFVFFLKNKRRSRDLNPGAATNDLLPFQGSPFNHLGTSPKIVYYLDFCTAPTLVGGVAGI